MENLYLDNIGLIKKWAWHYSGLCEYRPDISFEDLLQIGFLGLVEAKKTHDAKIGCWSTWASYFIRKYMLDALGVRSSKLKYTIRHADGTKETRFYKIASLNAPAYDDEPIDLVETIADESIPQSDARLIQESDSKAIEAAVAAIDDELIQYAVIHYYFAGDTYKRIAAKHNITPRHARNLCNKGLRLLRQSHIIRKMFADRIELETDYHAHKGIKAFTNTQSSTVEDAVIWREYQMKRLAKLYA